MSTTKKILLNIRGGGGPWPLLQEALSPRAVPRSRFTKLLLVPLEEPVEELSVPWAPAWPVPFIKNSGTIAKTVKTITWCSGAHAVTKSTLSRDLTINLTARSKICSLRSSIWNHLKINVKKTQAILESFYHHHCQQHHRK